MNNFQVDHWLLRFHNVCAHTWLGPHDCAQTRLCPHMFVCPDTFVPTHASAQTYLCPDTFVPRHVCAQTLLFPDTFVPRHICAQTRLCPDTFVPRHFCAQTWLCPLTLVPQHELLCKNNIIIVSTRLIMCQLDLWKQKHMLNCCWRSECDYLTSVQQSPAEFLLEYFVVLLAIACQGTKYVSGHKRTRFCPDTIVTTRL